MNSRMMLIGLVVFSATTVIRVETAEAADSSAEDGRVIEEIVVTGLRLSLIHI